MTFHKKILLVHGAAFLGLLVIQILLIIIILHPETLQKGGTWTVLAEARGGSELSGLIIAGFLGGTCALAFLFAWLIHQSLRRHLISPLRKLTERLQAIALPNNQDAIRNVAHEDELAGFTGSIGAVLEALQRSSRIHASTMRRYHTVVRQSKDGIMLVDASTRRILEANQAALAMLGLAEDAYAGLTLADLPDDGIPWVEDPIRQMEETGRPFSIEKKWFHPCGHVIHAEITMQLIDVDEERLLVVNMHDVTRRIQVERQILDRERNLSDQIQALTDLARKRHRPNHSLVEKFMVITEKTAEILHCDRVGVWGYDKGLDAFREIDGYLMHNGGHECRSPVTPAHLGSLHPKVLDERTVVIDDVHDCEYTAELNESLFQPREIGALLLVCIHFDGQPWGALSVQMNGLRRIWSSDEVHFAVSMADYASHCIQESERDKAEKALEERERCFSLLAQNVLDIIYRVRINPVMVFEYLSPAFEAITGYSPSLLMEDPDWILDHVHPDDIEMIKNGIAHPEAQGKSFVIRMTHKDGRLLWLEQCNVFIYDDEGNVIALEGISRDITQRIIHEEQFNHRLAIEEVIAEASRILLTPQGGDLNQILMRLGTCVAANRAYIFEFDDTQTIMSNTYEWCEPATEPMKNLLQEIPLKDTPWFHQQIRTRKVFIIPDIDMLAEIPEAVATYKVLSMQSILSLIIVPIRENSGRLRGLLGFDDTCNRRDWSVEDTRILTVVAEMIGNYWDRQRSEKARIESQRNLANLMSNIPGMAYRCRIDDKWTIEFVSQACEELTGYPPESLILNRDIAYADLIHPDDRLRVLSHVERAVATQERFNIEYRIIDRRDNVKWVSESGCILWDRNGELLGLDGLVSDISEQRRAQQALKESEERHRLLAENLTDIIWTIDLDFRYTYISPAVCQVRGYTQEEALGQSWLNIIHSEDIPQLGALIEELKAQQQAESLNPDWKATFEVRLRHKNGHYVWTEVKVTTLLDDDGHPVGFLGVSRDISKRKHSEQERALLEERVKQAQKLESLGLMAGGIAHDFNNLLMGVLGNAGLLKAELNESSPLHDRVEQIELATRRAAELTNQMLAFSGKGRFVVTRLDINQLIQETLKLLQSVISSKAVIENHFSDEPLIMEADASQIRQVVMNLITNASDALGDEEGVIRINTEILDLNRATLVEHDISDDISDELKEGRHALLTITDTGCGMDRKTSQRIFEPFFSTKFTGRGLGLAAVLGIVRGHRGLIKVESEPGAGTTFRVIFPLCDGAEIIQQESTTPDRTAWNAEGIILVADDEKLIRNISSEILGGQGFEVLTACDGIETLDLFEKHGESIRAVLLDLVMPRMDGAETYRLLKQARPDLPILLSSGYCEEDVTNRFPADAFLDFIHKPYLPQDLIDKLQAMLHKSDPLESSEIR